MKPSSPRFRRILLAGLGLGLAAAAATSIWPSRNQAPPRQQLPDGRWIGIQHVTRADTNGSHTVLLGAPWRLALAKHRFPDRLADWIRRDTGSAMIGGYSSSSLGLWWTAGDRGTNSTGYILGQVPDDLQNGVWRVVSDNGWVYPVETRGTAAGVDLVPLHRLLLDAFPRRQARMRAEMCNAISGAVIASFILENPYPVSTNVWEPGPMPATRQIGALNVHLDSIAVGVRDPKKPSPAFGMTRHFTPRVRLSTDGSAETGWDIASVQILDASGNRGEYLDPSEKAWKVRVEVRPKALTRAPRDVVVPVSRAPIRIPDRGEWQPMDRTLTLDGQAWAIVGIGGPGRHVFTNGLHSVSQPAEAGGFESSSTRIGANSTVSFGKEESVLCGHNWPGLPSGSRIVLRVRTADGRETAVVQEHRSGSFSFIPIPANMSGDVHLELVLQRVETVEFLVAPPRE